jgi:hypothetical protein
MLELNLKLFDLCLGYVYDHLLLHEVFQ